MSQNNWQRAEELVLEALELVKRMGEPPAFELVKLGQIAQARGDIATARERYSEGLAIFERLGMPEANQVRRMLAALDGRSPSSPTANEDDIAQLLAQLSPEERAQAEAQLQQLQQQLAGMSDTERAQLETAARMQQAVQQARAAAERRLWPNAIAHQQEAVAQARALAGQTGQREAWVQLSVLLYNLAGYCQQAGRHAEAVAAYEEVVSLDEQTGHEDLASDRQALAQARQLAAAGSAAAPAGPAAAPPELAALSVQLSPADRAALAQLPPEQQEQALQAIARFTALPPDEQEALARRTLFAQVEGNLLDQLSQLFAARRQEALSGEQQWEIADQLISVTAQLTADEALGEQRHALAELLRCAAARLRGLEPPPIPAAYAAQWAGWL